MKRAIAIAALVGAAVIVAGCASMPSPAALDQQALAMLKTSFRDQGIAKVDRLNQDPVQKACSSDKPPAEALTKQIEGEALAAIKWPAGGRYLGDWREGEKLAQSGRGMTWSDASAATTANGGNCYNCHQISPTETSFGTIGPSLYQFGKTRGNGPDIQKYVYGKIWNAKAFNLCSAMPRFGHADALNEKQIQDLVALLLDPQSPVNSK